MFTKSCFQLTTSLSNILHITVKIYIKSIDFQSKSESFTTENILPFTDDVMVVLEHKCLQQLQLLALHLEMLGYIPGLLNGFGYLHKIVDLSRDNLILYCFIAKHISIRGAENKFSGVTLTVGNKVWKLLVV